MKIRDLFAAKFFTEAKLLTSDQALENPIESAKVLETLDFKTCSTKNQLVMTSLYELQDTAKSTIERFFKTLKKNEVCALLVKLRPDDTDLPEFLIQKSNAYQVPLIQMPASLYYEKVLFFVYEPILNQQEHLLRTYYEVRQEFTKVERNLRSFDQIMGTFHRLIQLPCYLKIDALKVDLHYGQRFDNYQITRSSFFKPVEFTKNHYELLELYDPTKRKKKKALSVQIDSGVIQGALTVYPKTKKTLQSDLMIIENAIDLIHSQIQTLHLLKKERYTHMNNLADAILQNTPENVDELDSLLDEAALNNFPYYQGVACAETSGVKKMPPLVYRKMQQLQSNVIFFDHRNYTIFLFNLENKEDNICRTKIKQLFQKDHLTEQFTFSISQVKEKEDLKEILFECLETLRFNHSFFIDTVLSYQDLGIFQFFMRETRFEQILKIIPTKLVELWREDSEMFMTLYTFFQCDRNYQKTAQKLFVHPKTVRYRLKKIMSYLEIEVGSPMIRINYEIATCLLYMKGLKS